ncbi:MFS transporter [Ottowia sp.]|uniref:MFS transporter n=1 Tax=Ottowia sp. TaxID=1898956 RepID=UPI002C8DCF91|nr:MFS transporter [Ottowia sp.]HOB65772.1 MFS transporter [Ottowia sp.]HPZ58152.1 MFS transporter [Ottowia sp.]HQD47078.1 MFS transporter [Ottowia sp.]
MPDSDQAPSTTAPDDADLGALAPFQHGVFTMLWSTWLIANLCMWMNDVAAAWLMTTLTSTPIWVALVQTAATLPVFLLGLPSGALADILNRKRFLFFTQVWVAVVGALLALAVFMGVVTPPLLLVLLFLNGVGLALRWPVFAAIVPELVPRAKLPAALALNGVSMNASRIMGPLIAGAVIASLGSAWVFLLNAVLSVAAAVVITRWQREHKPHPLGRESLRGAMRVGLQYVAQSYHLKGVLLRIAIFFFHSTALMALLPLVARQIKGGDAGTFTVLLAAMGAGAIASTFALPRLRQLYSRDRLVLLGAGVQTATMALMAVNTHIWLGVLAMALGGAAWLTTANTLSVSAQISLPDWVRARGMSMYQMAIMGAAASGAAVWGQVATWSSVPMALGLGAASGIAAMAFANWRWPDRGVIEDPTPAGALPRPSVSAPPESGHVIVTVEYVIDPEDGPAFRTLMEESRRSRLRQGAVEWDLLADIHEPGRYIEVIEDASWTDHLRRFERASAADVALRERKLAFHIGDEPPRVRRTVRQSTVRGT